MKKAITYYLLLFISNLAFTQAPDYSVEIAYLKHHGQSPEEYVTGKFKKHDIVLLGEDHAIKTNLDFVISLIPDLYEVGVYNLGMEFGASEIQSSLDSLLTSPEYNEQKARDMMFFYNVGWAYKEYMDVYHAVWQFNKTLKIGLPKFRVLNLSYQYNWTAFEGDRNGTGMDAVFYKGRADEYRAKLIQREILNKNEKAILLVGGVHAFTRYQLSYHNDSMLGNRLYNRYPEKITNILLHMALYNSDGTMDSPGSGKLKTILELNGNQAVGFDLIDTPLGALPESSSFSTGYENFTLQRLFDGYIFLAPYEKMVGCTIDRDFYNGKSWDQVLNNYPDPDWNPEPKNLEEYMDRIESYANLKQRYAPVLKEE